MLSNNSRKGIAMPALLVLIAVIVVVGGIGYYALKQPALPEQAVEKGDGVMMAEKPITVELSAQNDSGELGKAILTEYEDRLAVDAEGALSEAILSKTKVTISLSGAPSGVPQPAHIHVGSCPAPGAIKYPLTSVISGQSETILDVSLEELRDQLPLAVNVHKSSEEAKVYVACGDIPADAMMMEKKGGAMMAKTHIVEITSTGFKPSTLEIAKGDTVEFVNRDTTPHWPASAMHPSHTVYPGSGIEKCGTAEEKNIFDACRGIPQSGTWSFVFENAGSWGYHDHLNSKLFGKIEVKESGAMMEPSDAKAMEGKGGMTVKYSGTVLAGKPSPLLDFVKADYEKAIASDKLVVLYFYANWCPICKAEFPSMQSAFNGFSNDKVIGFRVNYKDNQTDGDEENLARQFGVGYQHTKVFLKGGKQVLKAPDSWSKDRYASEIGKLL